MNNFLARFFYYLYKLFTDNNIVKTLEHPDYKTLVEYAFSVPDDDGNPIDFYNFRSAGDMPTSRFSKWNEFLEDYNRRIENDELVEIMKEMREQMDENTVSGNTNARLLMSYIEQRTQIAMDVDLFMRFMSVTYFTLKEDLVKYDWDIATWKIELWNKHGLHAFFLKEPIKKWLPQIEISSDDLAILKRQKKEIIRIFKKRITGKDT